MAGKQTELGKAFEYACVKALYDMYAGVEDVEIKDSAPVRTAEAFYNAAGEKQVDFDNGAKAAVRVIDRLEPRLRHEDSDAPLVLGIQSDAAGISGDVRDVLCVRRLHQWEIGLSCKHNHRAVKHSRLSDTIDFGKEWLGYPCSKQYFDEVVPIFKKLRDIQEVSKKAGNPAKWSDLTDKAENYYVPILQSFMKELESLAASYGDVPEKLVRYLLGKNDFYKVITDDTHRLTRVEAININGTLNEASEGYKTIVPVTSLRMPTKFYHIGFKVSGDKESQTTIHVVCDEGWEISMRLHNASTNIEPSLKFDVQLISFPASLFAVIEPWG